MRGPIVAWWVENAGGLERGLAVVGGAVLGGLLLGFLTGLLVRLVSTRKMPAWARNLVRLLGAVVSGWLVALWLFGGGGPGIGGSGGLGLGSGSGHGTSTARTPEGGAPPTAKQTPAVPPAENTVRIEILGPEALQKLPGKPDVEHCYRVEADGQPRLMTLGEVKDFLRERVKKEPRLRRVAIVLYKDSPARDTSLVTDLEEWVKDLPAEGGGKMKVDFELPDAPAG